ncbi:putative MFS family arabinose efflux permease [Thermosporothrix hazakensis]|jgi:MFS family permease|uniref:Putative MFS family arabinose efflux permease n=1 Tax=Thermosporothrix hazakensis TaxID=644383 RepID=A0A326TYQ8_THEHA|nr:MFS transporter [Thermosporothrix hazakensis]PZW22490.1 putative MFS family arabinose efflux permease [Thermosporothrix hazakensis]GCE50181.1 MFS transporter [Thermosporothrix hazakensis]
MIFVRTLKKPVLALLWSGQTLSAFGSQFSGMALLWLTTQKLGGVAGFIFGITTLVALLFGPLGGIIADRVDRGKLLIWTDIARALLLGILVIMTVLTGVQIGLLVCVVLAIELLGTIFDPALTASLPMLAGDTKTLYETNWVMETTKRLARTICPAISGVILAVLPFFAFFSLDALSFVVSAGSLLLIWKRLLSPPQVHEEQPPKKQAFFLDLWRDIATGYTLARKNTVFFWSLIVLGITNIAWSAAYMIGLPLWVQHTFHENAALWGMIASAYGLGNICSVFLGVLKKRLLLLMYLGKILQGASFLLLVLAGTGYMAVGSMFLGAIGGSLAELILVMLLQTQFPSEHLGKLYSLQRTISNVGISLGSMGASLLYAHLSPAAGIALCGVVIMLFGGSSLFLLAPRFQEREIQAASVL